MTPIKFIEEKCNESEYPLPTTPPLVLMTTTGGPTTGSSGGSSHSHSRDNSATQSRSVSSSLLHNPSSTNDSHTTLPISNGRISRQLQQQQQQQKHSHDSPREEDVIMTPSTKQKTKKKNAVLLWIFLFLLLTGMTIVVVVTSRVVKVRQRSGTGSSGSSSSSSIRANGDAAPGSASSSGSTAAVTVSPSPPTPSSSSPTSFQEQDTSSDAATSVPTNTSAPLISISVRRPTRSPTLTPPNVTDTSTAPQSSPPSNRPSTTRTDTPTTVPSTFPTRSIMPTELPWDIPTPEELYHHLYHIQNIPKEFRIKMHYEPQYMWQDETIERRWCIECTTCPYNNFDLTNTICDIVHQCTVGNQIWIVNCDAGYGQIFTIRPHILPHIPPTTRSRYITNPTEEELLNPISNYYYHQIQIVQNATTINSGVYTNGNPTVINQTNFTTIINTTGSIHGHDQLCLERTDTRYVTIQICHNFTTTTDTQNNNNNNVEYNPAQLSQLWDPLVSYNYIYNNNNNNSNNTTTANINMVNDGITVSNASYPTFTITPGIRLSQDIVTTNHNNHTNSNTTISWCLTNQHHPKSEEIVALKPCSISNAYDTGFWNIYPLS